MSTIVLQNVLKENRKKGCFGWNEYVVLEFDYALHWHHIYLDHGCPSYGFIFEMRTFTRSIYHKKVKFINNSEQKLKKQAIATAFINNNTRDFWSEITKICTKTQSNKCLLKVTPTTRPFRCVSLIIIYLFIYLFYLNHTHNGIQYYIK